MTQKPDDPPASPRIPGVMRRGARGASAEAGIATAADGVVLLDGPNGVAAAMTPGAALQTADSLVAAAREAQAQAPGRVVAADQDQSDAKDP